MTSTQTEDGGLGTVGVSMVTWVKVSPLWCPWGLWRGHEEEEKQKTKEDKEEENAVFFWFISITEGETFSGCSETEADE